MNGLVTGMGRSGTAWCAMALREVAGLDAHHERIGPDGDLRKLEGIEVSSRLRGRVAEARSVFSDLTVVHLVRDGRDVVRSAMSRERERGFTEVCRAWSYAVERLSYLPAYRLEYLTTQADAFRALADRFDATVDLEAWERVRGQRVNATAGYAFPHWSAWSDEQTDRFWRIAGRAMSRYGYEREER